jgi:hypothetical protein
MQISPNIFLKHSLQLLQTLRLLQIVAVTDSSHKQKMFPAE